MSRGKRIMMMHLGAFDQLSDAVSAYQAARKLHFGEYSGL